jgi:hypothetical protein
MIIVPDPMLQIPFEQVQVLIAFVFQAFSNKMTENRIVVLCSRMCGQQA